MSSVVLVWLPYYTAARRGGLMWIYIGPFCLAAVPFRAVFLPAFVTRIALWMTPQAGSDEVPPCRPMGDNKGTLPVDLRLTSVPFSASTARRGRVLPLRCQADTPPLHDRRPPGLPPPGHRQGARRHQLVPTGTGGRLRGRGGRRHTQGCTEDPRHAGVRGAA